MNVKEEMKSAQEHLLTGNIQKAADILIEILKVQPDNLDALFRLGLLCAQTKNFNCAIECFQEIVRMNPVHVDAYYNLGNAYRDKGLMNEASNCFQKVLQLKPDYIEAYINLGIIYRMKGWFNEEIECYQKAIQLDPDSAGAYFNLGHCFFEKEQFDGAMACYQKVVQLNPNSAQAYMNLGLILRIKGRHEEALTCYQRVIQLNPDDAAAHWNLSNVLLLLGNYKDGWREFEWFRKTEDCLKRQRNFSQPFWDGSDIAGQTIFLHAEEGYGDTIQFIRYASLVAERGLHIIVESQKELTSLLKNIEGVQKVLSRGEKLTDFDVHCPLMSLPRVFGTTLENIPAKIPYLTAAPSLVEQWRERIKHDNSKYKIGLVWSGGGLPFKKSCSLDIFSPFAGLGGIKFYSLQKGTPAERAKNPPIGLNLIDYTSEFLDFSDTAAFIENLDLVIAVDTAVAHLAGAIGKPVWVLLPYVPDWRWLLNREDSPWYPTMRLFRQPVLGDWKSVILNVLDNLQKKLREDGYNFLNSI